MNASEVTSLDTNFSEISGYHNAKITGDTVLFYNSRTQLFAYHYQTGQILSQEDAETVYDQINDNNIPTDQSFTVNGETYTYSFDSYPAGTEGFNKGTDYLSITRQSDNTTKVIDTAFLNYKNPVYSTIATLYEPVEDYPFPVQLLTANNDIIIVCRGDVPKLDIDAAPLFIFKYNFDTDSVQYVGYHYFGIDKFGSVINPNS